VSLDRLPALHIQAHGASQSARKHVAQPAQSLRASPIPLRTLHLCHGRDYTVKDKFRLPTRVVTDIPE
jgi:hypothetical protein